MSRTYRKIVGGKVPDGKMLRHRKYRFDRRNKLPFSNRVCYEDERYGDRCPICNSVVKRNKIPELIEEANMEDYEYDE